MLPFVVVDIRSEDTSPRVHSSCRPWVAIRNCLPRDVQGQWIYIYSITPTSQVKMPHEVPVLYVFYPRVSWYLESVCSLALFSMIQGGGGGGGLLANTSKNVRKSFS